MLNKEYIIHDVSRDLMQSVPYPGDPSPALSAVNGDSTFFTQALFTGLHTGTHLDAPLHVHEDGDVASVPLSVCMGPCIVSADFFPNEPRLLLRRAISPVEAAGFSGILVGTCAPSIATTVEDEFSMHFSLLKRGVVILENLFLDNVPDGRYFLLAIPLKISRAEASPIRALLLQAKDE